MLNVAVEMLCDSKKRVLLQHRTEAAKHLPGYWGFFGGQIEVGETPEEAGRREISEELNYTLKKPIFVMERDFSLPNTEGHMFVFIEPFLSDKSNLRLGEGQGWGWFKSEEVKNLKMIDHDKDTLRTATDFLDNNIGTYNGNIHQD